MLLLAIASRLLIGGLLLFSGSAKLVAGRTFRRRWLDSYFNLPPRVSEPVALAFSALEISIGSAYVLGLGGNVSGWGASALLAVVTLVVAATLLRGHRPSCGCGGNLSSVVSWRLVFRNLGFILVAAAATYFGPEQPGLGSAWPVVAVPAWIATGLAAYLLVSWFARRRTDRVSPAPA
jgi:hypothetical protein